MPRQWWVSPNLCTGLIVVAVSAMSCGFVYAGIVVLLLFQR